MAMHGTGLVVGPWPSTTDDRDTCLAMSWGGSGGSTGWHVYCDLDGVLSDFDAGVLAKCKKHPDEFWTDGSDKSSEMWEEISPTNVQFFSNLPWTSEGQDLWQFLSAEAVAGRCSVSLLTGLPRGNWAAPQKVRWCNQHLGDWYHVNLCRKNEKKMFARPGAVLIDDSKSDYERDWKAAGGKFVHHQGAGCATNTIRELRTIFESEPIWGYPLNALKTWPTGALPVGAAASAWRDGWDSSGDNWSIRGTAWLRKEWQRNEEEVANGDSETEPSPREQPP